MSAALDCVHDQSCNASQEYLGSYVTDAAGKLAFQEGALVRAARAGDWLILDELNLAPTDVLEALNRLLDDNRELFVPELNETVVPHPRFMLFGTQNPPGIYAGVLSSVFAVVHAAVGLLVRQQPSSCRFLSGRCRAPGIPG